MSLEVTFALAGFALLATVLFGWLGARPSRPLAPPRLAPWRAMMLAAFTAMVALLIHAVALIRG